MLDRDCVRMLFPREVTAEVKDKALHYLMFLKRKRSGIVKGRGVVDGRNAMEERKGNDCYVKFEGMMVKIICRINKKYEKCIVKSKYSNR